MSRNLTTSTSWQRYHDRADALRAVLARLDTAPAGELPWDDALARVFLDPDDLLEALHAMWTRRLLGRVDVALELGSGSLREAVAEAWQAAVDELRAVRVLLDRHADTEVVRRCAAGEHRLLAVAAGLATLSDPTWHSARLGAALVADLHAPSTSSRVRRLARWRPLRHTPAAVA